MRKAQTSFVFFTLTVLSVFMLAVGSVALAMTSTAAYAQEGAVQDTPQPADQAPAAEVGQLEQQGDESSLPGGTDDNVTVTLRELGLGPVLPDEFVTRLNYKKVDQDEPVQANDGWSFVWAHLTLDRLDVVSSQAMPTISLVDSAGETYTPDLNWSGIKLMNPQDLTSVTMAEGEGFAAFTIPDGADPVKLTFTYSVKEENPGKQSIWKRKKAQKKSYTVDIVLATGGDSTE